MVLLQFLPSYQTWAQEEGNPEKTRQKFTRLLAYPFPMKMLAINWNIQIVTHIHHDKVRKTSKDEIWSSYFIVHNNTGVSFYPGILKEFGGIRVKFVEYLTFQSAHTQPALPIYTGVEVSRDSNSVTTITY